MSISDTGVINDVMCLSHYIIYYTGEFDHKKRKTEPVFGVRVFVYLGVVVGNVLINYQHLAATAFIFLNLPFSAPSLRFLFSILFSFLTHSMAIK